MTRLVIAVIVCLDTSAPYTSARCAQISPVGQPLCRQGNNQIVDSGQPPLPFGDDFRLEAGIAVPRHGNLHRPGGLFINPITGCFLTATPATAAEKFYPHFHSPS